MGCGNVVVGKVSKRFKKEKLKQVLSMSLMVGVQKKVGRKFERLHATQVVYLPFCIKLITFHFMSDRLVMLII